ncbi:MAG: redoxin domain-containing protein [Phycisphaerae bacterium]|jgi:cytochrome c biogenesis protein CcmG/thiol:disulfide interchange protein DsbE|nr:redoxin domain-containing protein [Phycisphaerae bacterium]
MDMSIAHSAGLRFGVTPARQFASLLAWRLARFGRSHAHLAFLTGFLLVANGQPLVTCAQGATPAAVADVPDDWFFDGANRPKPLKELEGKPAPDLDVGDWIGDATSIKDNRGKVIVVDFWATWCGPCMASIPKNIELVKGSKEKGLVFIGVHDSKSGWDKASGVVSDKGINYPVAKDSGESVKRFSLQFWPTYVVIDRAGTVRAAGLLPDKVHDVVDMLLAEPPPADLAGASDGGNPPAWYFGGAKRPGWLKAVEGKKLPSLDVAKDATWFGEIPKADELKGRILIVHFLSPTSESAMKQFAELEKLAPEFAPQGVSFIGICDHRANWTAATAALKERGGKIPVLHDAAGTPEIPLGAKAAELGLRIGATTLIVDRTGTVRAAGVRADRLKEALTTFLAEPLPSSEANVTVDPGATLVSRPPTPSIPASDTSALVH